MEANKVYNIIGKGIKMLNDVLDNIIKIVDNSIDSIAKHNSNLDEQVIFLGTMLSCIRSMCMGAKSMSKEGGKNENCNSK